MSTETTSKEANVIALHEKEKDLIQNANKALCELADFYKAQGHTQRYYDTNKTLHQLWNIFEP